MVGNGEVLVCIPTKTFFKDDETKVGLERDNLLLIMDKKFFKERFAMSI